MGSLISGKYDDYVTRAHINQNPVAKRLNNPDENTRINNVCWELLCTKGPGITSEQVEDLYEALGFHRLVDDQANSDYSDYREYYEKIPALLDKALLRYQQMVNRTGYTVGEFRALIEALIPEGELKTCTTRDITYPKLDLILGFTTERILDGQSSGYIHYDRLIHFANACHTRTGIKTNKNELKPMLALLERAGLIQRVAGPHGHRETKKGKPPQYVLGERHPRYQAERNQFLRKAANLESENLCGKTECNQTAA
jgi:hypothetical protein